MELRDRSSDIVAKNRGRKCDHKGAAVIEFSLVAGLLCLLLFGIIEFGVILAVKASVTQAASEGGRSAVPQLWCPGGTDGDTVHCTYPNNNGIPASCRGLSVTGPDYTCLYGAATDQANKTLSWLNHSCTTNSSGQPTSTTAALQCTSTIDYCNGTDNSAGICITTAVVYDYKDNPIFPSIPLLSAFMPGTIQAKTTVRVNTCDAPSPDGGTPSC